MPNARVGGFLGGMSLEALCDPQLQPGETGPLPQPGHLARKGSGKMERAEATSVGLGMGPLVTGLTEQTFKNAISVMGERQKTLCGGKKNGCNST